MNFFFGFQNKIISSEITVPKFDYSGSKYFLIIKYFLLNQMMTTGKLI